MPHASHRILALTVLGLLGVPAVAQNAPAATPPSTSAAPASAEDPARSPDIRSAMAAAMRDAEFERIAVLSETQRRKLWDYYRQGKAAKVREAVLGMGLGALVRGFAAVEDVRGFVAAYKETGRQSGRLPYPHLQFVAAADKFPEAARLLAGELETAQKMAVEIGTLRGASAASLYRLNADSERLAADRHRRSADGYRQALDAAPAEEAVSRSVAAIATLLQEFK
jgi:hypothetical protein